jgi:WD40 repeat protein
LLRRIGRGSYGEVWLARSALGTLRAVKIVHRAAFEDARPFEREFKGIQKFEPISRSHEGLVDMLQVGRNDAAGYFYYVMELADPVISNQCSVISSLSLIAPPATDHAPPLNTDSLITEYSPRTLRSDLKQHGRLPVVECVRIGVSLADALAHLHRSGLVHRDIKPSNIIFVDGAPKLADIGLVAELGEARSFVGTEGFIPPEGPGTPQADLYSLGKVLYESATGLDRLDFPKLPANLRELPDAGALVEFNEIVLKACDDDLHRRYASAQALHEDLALLRAGKSIQRLRLVERRLALATRAGLALSALLVVAGGLYLVARRQAETNARLAATNAALATANARQLYAAEMNLAFQAWDAGNLARARSLLEKHRAAESDMRGFEWRLLEQLCGESDARFTLRGHSGVVWSLAIPPDDQRIVSAGADGAINVWDASTGTRLTRLTESNGVHAVAFSPDGRTLAGGDRNYTVTLRDAASFEVRHRMRRHSNVVRALAFSAEGRRLFSGGEDKRILIWNAADGTLIDGLAETMEVTHLAVSPDGSLLAATGNDTSVHLWDLARREFRAIAPQQSLLKAAAFSPDGRILAVAGYDGITELWEVARDQSLGILGGGVPMHALAFSPDGQWLATGSADAGVYLWNVRSRRRAHQWRGHTAQINALAFSRDGGWLVSASHDGTAKVWRTQSQSEQRRTLEHSGLVNTAAFASKVPRLATTSGRADTLRVWDLATGGELAAMRSGTNALWALAFSADGATIFTGGVGEDRSLRRWDVATRRATHTRRLRGFGAEEIALSPDGRVLATACRGGAPMQLWDAATLDLVADLPGGALVFRATAFSPDGQWLAAGGRGGEVLLWNVATRTLAAKLPDHASEVRSVAFSPDGATLAVGDDGRIIHLWSVTARQLQARLEGHDAPVKSVSFSPDGRTLASGSEDRTVKLWNLRLRQEVATLRGHASQVRQVVFSPDGQVLASAGGDGLVRLWRASQSALRSRQSSSQK